MNYIVAVIPPAQQQRVRAPGTRDALVAAGSPNVGIAFGPKDIPKTYFTDEASALAVAKDLAVKNPTVQYGVFAATRIFETTKPQVLEKTYNADNELVIKKGEEE